MFAFQANFDRENLAVVGKVEAGIVSLNNEEDLPDGREKDPSSSLLV